MKRALWVAACVLWLPGVAAAIPLVNTFTGVPVGTVGPGSWTEDGITALGSIGAGLSTPDSIHLDGIPGSTPYGKSLVFTTGGLFEPVSIDVWPHGASFTTDCVGQFPRLECEGDPTEAQIEPIPYIGIYGFLDGNLVESVVLYRPAASGFETISLEDFPTLDLLRVTAVTYLDLGVTGACLSNWCTHFSVDNVRLEPVPEPALMAWAGLVPLLLRALARRTA